MTNHWLCMLLALNDEAHKLEHDLIHDDGEDAENKNGNHHDHGGPLEFIPSGPGALFELFTGFLDEIRQPRQITLAP